MVMAVYNKGIIIIAIVIYFGKSFCCDIGNAATSAFENLANNIYKFH